MSKTAVSFRYSPERFAQVQRLRLYTDMALVTVVRYVMPLVHGQPLVTVLMNLYNAAGWFVILTVDPARIPEFTTTRIHQRKAWKRTIQGLPLLALPIGLMAWGWHVPILPHGLHRSAILSAVAGSLLPAYMDELLFRNVLQPKLRQFGLSKALSVLGQSILYAAAMYVIQPSPSTFSMALCLGAFNGWVVYKFRSLWPLFVVSALWRSLFL